MISIKSLFSLSLFINIFFILCRSRHMVFLVIITWFYKFCLLASKCTINLFVYLFSCHEKAMVALYFGRIRTRLGVIFFFFQSPLMSVRVAGLRSCPFPNFPVVSLTSYHWICCLFEGSWYDRRNHLGHAADNLYRQCLLTTQTKSFICHLTPKHVTSKQQ